MAVLELSLLCLLVGKVYLQQFNRTLVDLNVFLYPRTVFTISPKVENNLGIVAILVELPIFIVHFGFRNSADYGLVLAY